MRTGARLRLPPPLRLRRSGGRKRWAPRRWRRRRQRRSLPSRGRRAASSPPRAPPGGPAQLAPQRRPSCRDARNPQLEPARSPPSAAAAASSASAGQDPSPGGPGGGSGGGRRRRLRRRPAGGPREPRGAEEESLGAGGPTLRDAEPYGGPLRAAHRADSRLMGREKSPPPLPEPHTLPAAAADRARRPLG